MPKSTPKVTLLYPPEQNWSGSMCKPNGSLAYPMLGGALLEQNIDTKVFDACVGNEKDNLEEVFYKQTQLPSGMLRTGVSSQRILDEVADSDIIGITSIFSHQETMVLNTARLIKKAFPQKLLISGGVNARNRLKNFFSNGFDIICTSESEKTIVDIARHVEKGINDFSNIPMIYYRSRNGFAKSQIKGEIIWDLDQLPMPAWKLLPNERYWKIGRPHGGHFKENETLRYASMMTSYGCPFACSYCHIAGETENSDSGPIGRFRIKSDERVMQELNVLKDMGVLQVFIEDDSIFGMKKRAINLLKKVKDVGLEILDVNGINIIHLLKKGKPDLEVLDVLVDAGFRDIVLPFESAHPRIIKQWASNKWDINNSDIKSLIKACKDRGLRIAGNFMLGYPDESRNEIIHSINYAKRCMEYGLDACNFFLVIPLPGTTMFDFCIENKMLPKNFNPDKMHWQKANMINTLVSPKELEELRDKAWQETNDIEFTSYKKNMSV
ncbi:B12-binding domain-containing radical SAM protein [Prochlorococcus sp. MIT 0916]|uniref:B12-binding domain-containing radical SAM protein n=1 Tax=Prochlorococcus sp. MIT 0916 TaxID=3082521 RepID=UPI0039B469EF